MVSLRFLLPSFAASLPALVSAHGSMSDPMPTFADIYNKNAPSAFKSGTPGPYTGTEGIKDMADAAGSTCGKTDPNSAAQAAPSSDLVTFDISAVHIGPCEVWLDDTKVASAKDCWTTYTDKTIPVDYSKCTKSQCQLRWVWLATHNDPWEIFDNCANVIGPGGGGGSNSTTKPSTPTPSTLSPSSTTSSGSGSVYVPATVAPANASTSSSGSCFRGTTGNEKYDTWCKENCAAGYCPDSFCESC